MSWSSQANEHGGNMVAVTARDTNHDSSGLAGRLFLGGIYGSVVVAGSLLGKGWPTWALALLTLVAAVGFIGCWRVQHQGRLSFADPGLFFVFVICLYTAIPLLSLEYFGFNFGLEGDARLNHIALDQQAIADVWICSNLAMAGFGSAYLALRRPRMPQVGAIAPGAEVALWVGLITSGVVTLVLFISRGSGGGYLEEYAVFEGLPLITIQILNIITTMFSVCAFGLFCVYFTSQRTLLATVLWLGASLFFVVVSDARALLVLLTGSFFLSRDHFSKRLSPVTLATGAALGLALFLLLGLVREGSFALSDAAGRSEFISVFVTALDIQQLYVTGSTADMNVNLLLSDLLRLIPQQFLTFEKIDPASWYIGTFYPYYAEEGAGLAFGMISESVLGGGSVPALLRGLGLGILVSLSVNYLTRAASIWRAIVYLWLFLTLYQCFRDTTFTLLGRFMFQFGPALASVALIAQLLGARRAATPAAPTRNRA